MANTNTDLTEEDAADLQFPKDADPSTKATTKFSSSNLFNSDNNYCTNCFSEVISNYILCEKCNVNICLECFSKGAEFMNHKSDHDYRVLSTNFVLFENSDWTAEEELTLLDSMLSFGNWNMVAQELQNRSISEIIDHYDCFYLQRKGSDQLPVVKSTDAALFPPIVVPYRFKVEDTDDPPRYTPNTIGYKSLAGYNAARSDFENDFDKNAEDILARVELVDEDDPQYEFLTKLQCSLVQIYNRRLRERERRKAVIRNHGLLLLRKTISWLHRYDITIQKNVYEKLIHFMQFCEPTRFEMLMEGLHRAGELQIQISRLINVRQKGITTLTAGRLYLKLKEQREENLKSLKVFRLNPQYNWKSTKYALSFTSKYRQRRAGFAPIDIIGMPGYNKLSDKEKELCTNIRLVPLTYIQLREVLAAEQKRNGCVKLQTARRLLKIDVNKTRRLYDFLVEEGYITNQ